MSKKLTREAIEDAFYRTGDIIRNCAKYRFIKELEKRGFLEEEPLTFQKIRKECISGDTILVDTDEYKFTFIGFYNGKVVVGNFGHIHEYMEEDIVNWIISK